MMPVIEFWYEFASSYSYLAAMRVDDMARRAGVAVAWRPFLLGPIFQRQGWNDSPFNLFPVRGRYMWRDIERQCRILALPFRRPGGFPRRSLLAARVACLGESEAWLPEFSRAVFTANFGEDRDIADPGLIAALLDALGEPGGDWVARAGQADSKDRLRRRTEEAWERGVFGAPTWITEGELFWGNDRLEQALSWARGER